jgi:hypothetical protein
MSNGAPWRFSPLSCGSTLSTCELFFLDSYANDGRFAHEAKDEAAPQAGPDENSRKLGLLLERRSEAELLFSGRWRHDCAVAPGGRFARSLFAQVQLSHDLAVPLETVGLEVVQQSSPLADQPEQAPPRVMIFDVGFEVVGELADALGNDGDLNFGRARVFFVSSVLLDEFCFFGAKNHGKMKALSADAQLGGRRIRLAPGWAM